MGGDFRLLKAWQHADELAILIYQITQHFPSEERYGLVQQMRRAAVSVVANVAEGATRDSIKEFAQFLSIARGSLAELECYLSIAQRLGCLQEASYQTALQRHRETGRTLHGLLRSVNAEGECEHGVGRCSLNLAPCSSLAPCFLYLATQ